MTIYVIEYLDDDKKWKPTDWFARSACEANRILVDINLIYPTRRRRVAKYERVNNEG